MSRSAHFCRNSKLPSQEIQGQVVIIVPSRSEMHQLDEVGTFLWGELARGRSAEDLAQAVCREFDANPGQVEKDVRAFLKTLDEKGLLSQD
jgi:hypothetical protein